MVTQKVPHDYLYANKLTVWVAGEKFEYANVSYYCRGFEITIKGMEDDNILVRFHRIQGVKADIDPLYRWDI